MAKVAYIRVSTVDQSTERQLDGLTFYKTFEDKCSGKDIKLLERQREGILKAKQAGKYKGRPKEINYEEILNVLKFGVSIRKTATQLGVSVSTVQ